MPAPRAMSLVAVTSNGHVRLNCAILLLFCVWLHVTAINAKDSMISMWSEQEDLNLRPPPPERGGDEELPD
jgi:hypothetical protein